MQKTLSITLAIFLVFTFSCKLSKVEKKETTTERKEQKTQLLKAPDWSKNANIYEVNIRQYTKEGTFNAFAKHLQRLRTMGVDILWFMPIHPIGKKNRKGSLGSPYASKDYKGINPDFGTKEDFKKLVEQAHSLGFKVLIDWVANHSAFDNIWAIEHPEWYTQDNNGNIIHPKDTDWTDVADLNYDNKNMRAAMIDAMKYWITDFNIDGFRCDVAGFVPYDFWAEAIGALHKIKHVFMLAEWEDPKIHEAGFHMTYGWHFHHIMNSIAKGKMNLSDLDKFLLTTTKKFSPEDYRMNFTTNHDENSWNGTTKERMGDAADAFAILAFTANGMPLVYSGQEAGLNKRLSFFDKDEIDWSDLSKQSFFQTLLELKHNNKALWNGNYGGNFTKLKTNNDNNIFAYKREKDGDKVIVFINFSNKNQTFSFIDSEGGGIYHEVFLNEEIDITNTGKQTFALEPWSYNVLSNRK